ncbi:hypothetical protein OIU79_015715 [Salix purpurea]|uniref:Uncharacterized protein n=1 Tax=Salix purpurea TaxID=77065 RepID=A0A9Q0PCP1_SALPP|nr:hypothetical protein OIU79_015715 [Salix purpurea]
MSVSSILGSPFLLAPKPSAKPSFQACQWRVQNGPSRHWFRSWRDVDRVFFKATEEVNCTSQENKAKKESTMGHKA